MALRLLVGSSRFWLAAILLIGAAVRFYDLRVAPAGLNQDEAANAWNAYCLLKTGTDQAGAHWPIFYYRAFGENRSALFLYLLLPFQAVGGLNVWTTRLPSAVAGVASILLIYYVGSRVLDRRVGIAAALLLALSPWAIQQSRWGHEAAICLVLVLAPLAALLWAGFPIGDAGSRARPGEVSRADEPANPRRYGILRAAIAGLVAGACCYGYPAVRLFLPPLLAAVVIVTWRRWRELSQNPPGRKSIAALAVGFGATFGPLLWMHLIYPDEIARRADVTWLWEPGDPTSDMLHKAVARYAAHFGPDFLFVHGDTKAPQWLPTGGVLDWYLLPLLLSGTAAALFKDRSSASARVLLACLVLYPAGDCLSRHDSMHGLRSLPGLPGLILLAAYGAIELVRWAGRRSRGAAWAVTCVLLLLAAGSHLRFLRLYFGEYDREPAVRAIFQADLSRACEWLRPRFEQADAVFITAAGTNMPYAIALVQLGYDPRRWFSEPREFVRSKGWDVCQRFGKVQIVKDFSPLVEFDPRSGRRAKGVFIIRPFEMPVPADCLKICDPDGTIMLVAFERDF